MRLLEGKVAVVAGATRGAGRGIARALGEALRSDLRTPPRDLCRRSGSAAVRGLPSAPLSRLAV